MQKPNMISSIGEAAQLSFSNFFSLIMLPILIWLVSTITLPITSALSLSEESILGSLLSLLIVFLTIPFTQALNLATIDRMYGIKNSWASYIAKGFAVLIPTVLSVLKIFVIMLVFGLIYGILLIVVAFGIQDGFWVMAIVMLLLFVPMVLISVLMTFVNVHVAATGRTVKLRELFALIKPHFGGILVGVFLLFVVVGVISAIIMGLFFALVAASAVSGNVGAAQIIIGTIIGLFVFGAIMFTQVYAPFFVNNMYAKAYEYAYHAPIVKNGQGLSHDQGDVQHQPPHTNEVEREYRNRYDDHETYIKDEEDFRDDEI